MRGRGQSARSLFSYVSLEERVPRRHPLRRVRAIVDEALESLSPRFEELYSKRGRPSVPPEHLLRALLLQALYSVRSERQLMERLEFDMLFRWFVGLELDERVWDATTFTKNRDRVLDEAVAKSFFAAVLERARGQRLLSRDHFTVDGTLIEAWASHKSFRPKGGGDDEGGSSFRGRKRANETHESTTDPECRLMRKGRGKEARLSYQGNVLTENRNGLIVGAEVVIGEGAAETEGALRLLESVPGNHRVTVGADKLYDNRSFVEGARALHATPHVIQSLNGRRSRIDGRTVRHAGYTASVCKRPAVEGPIGWMKQYGLLRRPMFRGCRKMNWAMVWNAAAFNILRIARLEAAA